MRSVFGRSSGGVSESRHRRWKSGSQRAAKAARSGRGVACSPQSGCAGFGCARSGPASRKSILEQWFISIFACRERLTPGGRLVISKVEEESVFQRFSRPPRLPRPLVNRPTPVVTEHAARRIVALATQGMASGRCLKRTARGLCSPSSYVRLGVVPRGKGTEIPRKGATRRSHLPSAWRPPAAHLLQLSCLKVASRKFAAASTDEEGVR